MHTAYNYTLILLLSTAYNGTIGQLLTPLIRILNVSAVTAHCSRLNSGNTVIRQNLNHTPTIHITHGALIIIQSIDVTTHQIIK